DFQPLFLMPPSMSANVGQTVQITCSGGSSSYGYYSWHQQKVPGSGPVTVIYSNSQRPSDIPSRFSASTSGSTSTLTTTGVQAEDEAVYYCAAQDGRAGQHPDAPLDGHGGCSGSTKRLLIKRPVENTLCLRRSCCLPGLRESQRVVVAWHRSSSVRQRT
uniref:Ig-like domain-containing protein n=1 Tax=Aquila chrysaetos chrysaetos TaxID=223781 RepID=A0A663E517_AQUCH